jgi:predicted Zn-dependent protease with MMP-like domain
MPELDANNAEFDDNEVYASNQDEYTSDQKEKDPRFLFGALSCVIALLFIIVYFNAGFNSLFLLGTIIFGLIGMVLMSSRRRETGRATATTQGEQKSGGDIKDTLSPFELLVKEALDSIPLEFQEKMDNVLVRVESEPDEEVLERVGLKEGHVLLGLYEGVPLTAWHRQGTTTLPECITIYQRTIEDYCGQNPERIRNQVRNTVLHEVAHHFGMGHEEMPIWVK